MRHLLTRADSRPSRRVPDDHTDQSDADIVATLTFGRIPQRRMTGQASLSANPPQMLGAQSMVPAHLRTVVSVPEIASFIQSSFQLSFECGLRWSHTIALDGLYWTWGIIYALTKKTPHMAPSMTSAKTRGKGQIQNRPSG